jgi:hypothetical protein
MKNTTDVTGGKPIVVLFQFISGVSSFNPLVSFYDIHGGKREVPYYSFICPGHLTRPSYISNKTEFNRGWAYYPKHGLISKFRITN